MYKCDTKFTMGGCEGHYGGKFDDCRALALYELGMFQGSADDETGNCDFEGYFQLFLLDSTEGVELDSEGGKAQRIALVEPGHYILATFPSGGVSLWSYETRDAALAEFGSREAAYLEWDDQD